MPTVLITGGTGLIGKKLTSHLIESKYDVIVLTRKPAAEKAKAGVTYAAWDIGSQQIDNTIFEKADYIIHLTGAGVMDKRWTARYKKEIEESRVKSSQLLVSALSQSKAENVKAIVSASAIGWYGEDPVNPFEQWDGFKETDKADAGFLGNTCKLWEESIEPVTGLGKRLVKLRLGIVLSNDGGAFTAFKNPLRVGIAAILGNGEQMISWIHIDDVCRLFVYAIENPLSGSYNAVSPDPVSNKKLIIKTADLLRKSFYIPVHVPAFILRLLLGRKSAEILKSATVRNDKIKKAGFTFLYPTLDAALGQLLER